MYLSFQIKDHLRLMRPMVGHCVTHNSTIYKKNIMTSGFTFPH